MLPSDLKYHKMICHFVNYQRWMVHGWVQIGTSTTSCDRRDCPLPQFRANRAETLIQMGVASNHKVDLGLVKQRQITLMTPGRPMSSDIIDRHVQENEFPRRTAR